MYVPKPNTKKATLSVRIPEWVVQAYQVRAIESEISVTALVLRALQIPIEKGELEPIALDIHGHAEASRLRKLREQRAALDARILALEGREDPAES
jgi:hypothetical protein